MGHIETAVGMFNAGEFLREYFQKHAAGTASASEKAGMISTLIPMTVFYIFGIEVGIKALIEKQGQKPPRIHDLKNLYGELGSSIKVRIEDKLKAQGADFPRAENLLSYHRNSFEEWRYMGESGDAKGVDPSAIAATLRSIIEVHTEAYGMETSKAAPNSRKEGDVPTSVQRAAAEYVKMTSVAEAEETPEGS